MQVVGLILSITLGYDPSLHKLNGRKANIHHQHCAINFLGLSFSYFKINLHLIIEAY